MAEAEAAAEAAGEAAGTTGKPRRNSYAWRVGLYVKAPQPEPAGLADAVREREELLVLRADLEQQLSTAATADGPPSPGTPLYARRLRIKLARERSIIRTRYLRGWIHEETQRIGASLPRTRGEQPDLLASTGTLLVRLIDRDPALLDTLSPEERATLGAAQEWLAARSAALARPPQQLVQQEPGR